MTEMHVSSSLLEATLENKYGHQRKVMAIWLDQAVQPALLMALVVEVETGVFFKVILPDRDWTLAKTEPYISRRTI